MEHPNARKLETQTKDGVPLAVGNIPQPEEMFFYERPNGSIFNVGNNDAARIHNKFKFLGKSDGVQYANAIKELQGKFQTLTKQELRNAMLEAWSKELEIARGNFSTPILPQLDMGLGNRGDSKQIQLRGVRDEIK